jgi:hypothetical protein
MARIHRLPTLPLQQLGRTAPRPRRAGPAGGRHVSGGPPQASLIRNARDLDDEIRADSRSRPATARKCRLPQPVGSRAYLMDHPESSRAFDTDRTAVSPRSTAATWIDTSRMVAVAGRVAAVWTTAVTGFGRVRSSVIGGLGRLEWIGDVESATSSSCEEFVVGGGDHGHLCGDRSSEVHGVVAT